MTVLNAAVIDEIDERLEQLELMLESAKLLTQIRSRVKKLKNEFHGFSVPDATDLSRRDERSIETSSYIEPYRFEGE